MPDIGAEEQARLLRELHRVPHPDEVAAALERIHRTTDTTFELDIQGWRTVWLTSPVPMPNRLREDLTVVFFRPVLVVATLNLSHIDAWLAVTETSLQTGRGTLLADASANPLITWRRGNAVPVGFRASNAHAEKWLRLTFARASGMRFRRHGLVDPSKIIYTRDA